MCITHYHLHKNSQTQSRRLRHKKGACGSQVPCQFSLYWLYYIQKLTLHTKVLSTGCTRNFLCFFTSACLTFQHPGYSTKIFLCNALCACRKPVTIYQLPGEHQKSSSLERPVKPLFRFIQAVSTTTGTLFEPCKFSMLSSSWKTIPVVTCGNFKKASQFQVRWWQWGLQQKRLFCSQDISYSQTPEKLFWLCPFWTYVGLAHKWRKLRIKSIHNIEVSEWVRENVMMLSFIILMGDTLDILACLRSSEIIPELSRVRLESTISSLWTA